MKNLILLLLLLYAFCSHQTNYRNKALLWIVRIVTTKIYPLWSRLLIQRRVLERRLRGVSKRLTKEVHPSNLFFPRRDPIPQKRKILFLRLQPNWMRRKQSLLRLEREGEVRLIQKNLILNPWRLHPMIVLESTFCSSTSFLSSEYKPPQETIRILEEWAHNSYIWKEWEWRYWIGRCSCWRSSSFNGVFLSISCLFCSPKPTKQKDLKLDTTLSLLGTDVESSIESSNYVEPVEEKKPDVKGSKRKKSTVSTVPKVSTRCSPSISSRIFLYIRHLQTLL